MSSTIRKLNGKRKYSQTASAMILAVNDGGDKEKREVRSCLVIAADPYAKFKVTMPLNKGD